MHAPACPVCYVGVRQPLGHTHEVSRLGLSPRSIEIEIEGTLQHVNEFILGRMNMWRYKSSRRIEGFEDETTITFRFEPICMTEYAPHHFFGLTCFSGA